MTKRVRDRRPVLFTITPIALALLAVAGLITVVATGNHRAADDAVALAAARPAASRSTAAVSPDDPAVVAGAVKAIDAQQTPSVTFGVAVLDTATGKETLGRNAATPFYCASVLKLFLITALLHDQEQGRVHLTGTDYGYLALALERSDDNSMNQLWVEYSGPKLVTEMVALAQLRDTKLPADTSQWGQTLISARDVIAVYQYVLHSLSPADRDLVLGHLSRAGDTGTDGFDQAFGLLHEPRPANVKGKQGWMCFQHLEMLHTTGTLGSAEHYVVALLSHQPETGDCQSVQDPGWAPARDRVTAAAQTLITALGPAASR
jgi:hypothetical protein